MSSSIEKYENNAHFCAGHHVGYNEALKNHLCKSQDWISVEDKLPDDEIFVLIYCGNHPEPKGIFQARKITHSNKSYTYFTMEHNRLLLSCEVTHWMPLPEPPE